MLQVVVAFQFFSWMGYHFLATVLPYLNLKLLCHVLRRCYAQVSNSIK